MNTILLLTACINPNGMEFTTIQNCHIRRKQYETALSWYLENTIYPIVFVENTNTYIGEIYQKYIDSKRIEFITFQGNNYPRHLGKGYGEALIIQEAIQHSSFITNETNIVKITGRLIIKNINSLINEIPKNNSTTIASTCTIKSNYICNSYFVIAPTSFYTKYFFKEITLINDSEGRFFEHILFQNIVKWIKDEKKYHEFYHFVNIIGLSGSTGKPYEKAKLSRILKSLIKAIYINIIRQQKYIFKMNQ